MDSKRKFVESLPTQYRPVMIIRINLPCDPQTDLSMNSSAAENVDHHRMQNYATPVRFAWCGRITTQAATARRAILY